MNSEFFQNDNEFFIHKNRINNNRELIYGEKNSQDHNHAVFDQNGNVKFLRENEQIIADDQWDN